MPVYFLREMRPIRTIARHTFLFVYSFANVMPLNIAAARPARADFIARRPLVIEAGVEPLVLIGQEARLRPSHRLIVVVDDALSLFKSRNPYSARCRAKLDR